MSETIDNNEQDYSHVEEKDEAPREERGEKTYWLDGTIIVNSVSINGDVVKIDISPFQGSPELVSDRKIDDRNPGSFKITVSRSEFEKKDESGRISLGGIIDHNGSFITKEALRIQSLPRAA